MTLPLLYVIACKSALSLRRPGRCPHALLAVLETGAAPPPGRCPGPFWGPMPPVIRSRLRAPHSPLPRPARCSHTRARAPPPKGGGNKLVSAVVRSAEFANLETQNGKEHLAYMEDSP